MRLARRTSSDRLHNALRAASALAVAATFVSAASAQNVELRTIGGSPSLVSTPPGLSAGEYTTATMPLNTPVRIEATPEPGGAIDVLVLTYSSLPFIYHPSGAVTFLGPIAFSGTTNAGLLVQMRDSDQLYAALRTINFAGSGMTRSSQYLFGSTVLTPGTPGIPAVWSDGIITPIDISSVSGATNGAIKAMADNGQFVCSLYGPGFWIGDYRGTLGAPGLVKIPDSEWWPTPVNTTVTGMSSNGRIVGNVPAAGPVLVACRLNQAANEWIILDGGSLGCCFNTRVGPVNSSGICGGGSYNHPNGLSPSQFVGRWWDQVGGMHNLPLYSGYYYSDALAINDAGWILGRSIAFDAMPGPYRWFAFDTGSQSTVWLSQPLYPLNNGNNVGLTGTDLTDAGNTLEQGGVTGTWIRNISGSHESLLGRIPALDTIAFDSLQTIDGQSGLISYADMPVLTRIADTGRCTGYSWSERVHARPSIPSELLFERMIHVTASGSWDSPALWSGAAAPTPTDSTGIAPVFSCTVTGPSSSTTVRSLTIGSRFAGNTARLELQPGATLTSTIQTQVLRRGVLAGAGTLTTPLLLVEGRIEPAPSQVLTISGDVDLSQADGRRGAAECLVPVIGNQSGSVVVSGAIRGAGWLHGSVSGAILPTRPLFDAALVGGTLGLNPNPMPIGNGTVTGVSTTPINVGPMLTLAGGTFRSASGMTLAPFDAISGFGTIVVPLSVGTFDDNASISAVGGTLEVGDPNASTAFMSCSLNVAAGATLSMHAESVRVFNVATLSGGELILPDTSHVNAIAGSGTVTGDISSFTVNTGGPSDVLVFDGNLSVESLLTFGGTIIVNGDLEAISVDAGGGDIIVHGNVTIQGFNARVVSGGGTVQIDGDLVMLSGDAPAFVTCNGGSITVGGSIRGAGILAGPITSDAVIAEAPLNVIFYDVSLGTPPARLLSLGPARFRSTLTLDGTLDAPTGLIMDCVLRGCPCLRCGQLSGSGVINGDVSSEQGTITPGFSPGLITINGDFSNNGALNMEIAGPLPVQYDRLAISGTANLGGTLNVGFIDDYTPTAASSPSFGLLTFSASTGAFASINLPGLPEGLEWDTQELQTSGGVSVHPSCRADVNDSGVLSVQDIFDFLAFYFSDDPRGDFNQSGVISVQDIFDFLAAYFTGC